jgi:hypothetical protein
VLDGHHGCTEALTDDAADGEVLAYVCAYHEAEEGCGCGEGVFLAAAA